MFYPHTIKGKPFPRLDKISEPTTPLTEGPIFTIDTSATGASTSGVNQFKLPLIDSDTYFFTVSWGDGKTDSIINFEAPETLHTYDSPGIYEISITGVFRTMAFNGEGDAIKMLEWIDWNTGRLTEGMFWGCVNLTFSSLFGRNIHGLSLKYAFRDCQSMTDQAALEILGTTVITSFEGMFWGCTVFDQDLSAWSVSTVLSTKDMFRDCPAFNQDFDLWDVSAVTNFDGMFRGATIFNGNVTTWTTTAATRISSMFRDCPAFNQDISIFDVSNVTNAEFMFFGATIFNQNIGGWITSNFFDIAAMFLNAPAFNQDITGWDVSNVISAGGLFLNATSFNQAIGVWTTTNLATMLSMFQGATSFNQDLSNWDTSNVDDMISAFNGATAFNQDISSFDVGLVEDMSSMLDGSGLSTANYDLFLISCDAQTVLSNVPLGAGGLTYTGAGAGGTARASLTTNDLWTISGDSSV